MDKSEIESQIKALKLQKLNTCGHTKRASIDLRIEALEDKLNSLKK